MRLISLVGEQPIPNLIVSRMLNPDTNILLYTQTTERVAQNLLAVLPSAESYIIAPYDLTQAAGQIAFHTSQDTVINLTGGTKLMALAAYEAARGRRLPVVYLRSEGPQAILYRYRIREHGPELAGEEAVGTLIDIDDYLRAHGVTPLHETGPQNAQEAGLRRWLESQVEECRSNLIFSAFEVDFILRRGNRVTLLETKMTHKNTREGIDQLNTAAGRAFLGTYTGKILVVSKPLGPQLSRLAQARNVQVVTVTGKLDARTGRLLLDQESRNELERTLERILGSDSSAPAP
jgi:hypothetical protein